MEKKAGKEVIEVEKESVSAVQKIAEEYLKMVGHNIPSQVVVQFLHLCRAYNLNPFKREIYLIPYTEKKTNVVRYSIIVGYEVYLKRAERSGKLAGWKVWVEGSPDEVKKFIENQDYRPEVKACITIKRKDWEEPFYHEVYLFEYFRNNEIWKSKPFTMLKKVAVAQGFRLCFPEELGGIPYIQEEIEVDFQGGEEARDVIDVVVKEDGTIVNTQTGEVVGEKKEEKNRWDLAAIRKAACEELKKLAKEARLSAKDIVNLFQKYDGDQKKIIKEIKSILAKNGVRKEVKNAQLYGN